MLLTSVTMMAPARKDIIAWTLDVHLEQECAVYISKDGHVCIYTYHVITMGI